MAVYFFRRRRLLSTLFIFMMIQGITSLPHRFFTGSDDSEHRNHDTPSRPQTWYTDGNSQIQKRPANDDKRPGVDLSVDPKSEGKIVSPSDSYLNYGVFSSLLLSTTQRSKLDWDLQQRKVLDKEKRPAVNRNPASDSDSRIVFPSDENENRDHNREKISSVQVPVCQGSTFCENSPVYPEDLLNSVISQTEEFKYLSGIDVISNVVQRIDVSEDMPLCLANEQVVYPKSAENQNREWLFVVNHRNFTQGVRIESCSSLEGECGFVQDFAEGYKTTCKQKYIYRQLAAISSSGSVKPDMFRFPSSCCCHVKFVGNPILRMGVSLKTTNVTPAPKKTTKK